MRKEVTPEVARQRLETLCARSEQSTFDLRRKLYAWHISPLDQEEIVNALQRARFVDDRRFAMAFARDKLRFNHWGPEKIRLGLIAKQIDRPVVDEALAQLDESEIRDNLVSVLRSKAGMIGEESNTYDGRTRLFRYGASRGYRPAMVIDVIKSGELWR